jgi:excisionase family DNA binding protein
MNINDEQLLSITKAAKILGIHPLTLRNWSEKGQIPFYRTPGGHRRFRQQDLLDFMAGMSQNTEAKEMALVNTTHQALRRVLAKPSPTPTVVRPVWQQNLSEQQRVTMRGLGKRLLGMTLHYAAGNADESTLEKGRELGQDYGQAVRSFGWSITEAVATFNFFRDSVIDSTFAGQHADTAQTQLYQRLNQFFNEVLLAMIQLLENEEV